MGEQDLAISTLEQAVAKEPDSAFTRVWLACALVEAGLQSDAALVAREAMRIDPTFTATDFQRAEFKDPKVGEKIVKNLLRAGLPA